MPFIFLSNISMQLWNYAVMELYSEICCLYDKLHLHSFFFLNILLKNYVINCSCYISTVTTNRKKLDPHAKVGIFMVSNQTSKVMLFMIFSLITLMFLRMLYFMEIIFPIHIHLRKTKTFSRFP